MVSLLEEYGKHQWKAYNLLRVEAARTSAEFTTYPMIGVGLDVAKEKWCPIADRHCLREGCAWWDANYKTCYQNLPGLIQAKRWEIQP